MKLPKRRYNITVPVLLTLSLLLNYGQAFGWVTFPKFGDAPETIPESILAAYADDGDALPPVPPRIKGGF